mgnify:CR=1 FL=1
MVKKVLSLAGGGVRTLYSAVILDALAHSQGQRLHEMFDLVVGTSGGAVLALYIGANGPKPLADLFAPVVLKRWCQKTWINKWLGLLQMKPKYDGVAKHENLREEFGALTMHDLKTHVAVLTVNISRNGPELFTSYDPICEPFLVADIANATSAATPYFPAVRLSNGENYVDGGFGANSPTLLAYDEALNLFGTHEPIQILSLGAGIRPQDQAWLTDKPLAWGALPWLMNNLVDLMLGCPGKIMNMLSNHCVSRSPNCTLLHIDCDIQDIAIDDVSDQALQRLRRLGQQSWAEEKDNVLRLLQGRFATKLQPRFVPTKSAPRPHLSPATS